VNIIQSVWFEICFLKWTHHLVFPLKKMVFILSMKNVLKLMYMATSHCHQWENQVIKRDEESGEILRSNCKQRGKIATLNYVIIALHPLNTYYIAKRNVIDLVSSMLQIKKLYNTVSKHWKLCNLLQPSEGDP